MEIGSQKLKYNEYYASIKILVLCCGISADFELINKNWLCCLINNIQLMISRKGTDKCKILNESFHLLHNTLYRTEIK
jgi:hypothetical protein